jgi:urea transport system permease protein
MSPGRLMRLAVARHLDLVGLGLLAVLLALVFPALLDDFRLGIIAKYLSLAIAAVGVVLVWGYCGILSLGQGVFFGMGGYFMAMYLKLAASAPNIPDFMDWSSVETLPWFWEPFHSAWFAIGFALVVPALVAFVFAFLMFQKRVGDVYFSIITLALSLTLSVFIVGQQGYTGGINGITDFRTFAGWDITSDAVKRTLYLVTVALLLVMIVVGRAIVLTRLGKVLVAIRDREDRVRFSGYNPAAFKAFIFAVAALYAAVGGALYTLQVGLISPTLVAPPASVELVIYAAVGGRTSLVGAAFGTLLVGLSKSFLSENFPALWLFLLGGLFLGIVLILPAGLAGLLTRFRVKVPPDNGSRVDLDKELERLQSVQKTP